MSDHDTHDIQKHLRTYYMVGGALLVGTALTVGMYYVHFDSMALTIAVALFIATVKASLVAGFFMHLISEKKAIYAILASTVFFVIGLLVLTSASFADIPKLPF